MMEHEKSEYEEALVEEGLDIYIKRALEGPPHNHDALRAALLYVIRRTAEDMY